MTPNLESLLTDPNPDQRVKGRLLATGFSEAIDGWVHDELGRGTDFATMASVLSAALFGRVAFLIAAPGRLLPHAAREAFLAEVLQLSRECHDIVLTSAARHCLNLPETEGCDG